MIRYPVGENRRPFKCFKPFQDTRDLIIIVPAQGVLVEFLDILQELASPFFFLSEATIPIVMLKWGVAE